MSKTAQISVLSTASDLESEAAEKIVAIAQAQIAAKDSFLLVLAGGTTPKGLYQLLAQEPFRSQIAWEKVHIFWSDERFVPFEHPENNYRLAHETLLQHVPIPATQIHPIPTASADPQTAAQTYQQLVKQALKDNQNSFDLVILGMGEDGHTAALFPYHAALYVSNDCLVLAIANAPKPPSQRVSLTLGALNRAANIFLLVTGEAKAATLHEVWYGPDEPQRLPVQALKPSKGEVLWLVDMAAAHAPRSGYEI